MTGEKGMSVRVTRDYLDATVPWPIRAGTVGRLLWKQRVQDGAEVWSMEVTHSPDGPPIGRMVCIWLGNCEVSA